MRFCSLCVGLYLFSASTLVGADSPYLPSLPVRENLPTGSLPKEKISSKVLTSETTAKTEPAVEVGTNVTQPSQEVKDRTHIIVFNGLDPLYLGKLDRFCQWVECAGYKNVHLFAMRGYRAAERKICCIRQEDPGAKIVLTGYSWGANEVRSLCASLQKKGICIDLLVYMAGDMVGNRECSRPENAARIVNINAHGLMVLGGDLFWNGADIDGAKNYRVDCMHLGMPRRTDVLDIFLAEVAGISCAR